MHALALPPFVSLLSAETDVASSTPRFEDDVVDPRAPLQMDELVRLGIDESPHASLAWVGYDEYRKHLADLAEIEQAAFVAAEPGIRIETPTARPDVAPDEAETVATAETREQPAPDDRTQSTPEAPKPESALRAESPPRAEPDPAVAEAALPVLRAFLEAAASFGPSTMQPQDAPRSEAEARSPETGKATAAATANRMAEPTPPPPQPAATAEMGDVASKESDATSVIEVALNMLGQPIASEGLELRPRRPFFPPLVRVTAVFGNPLVEIMFGRDGKPAEATILESSGDSRIDHAIGVSLYRWRATGAALERLAPEDTLSVRLRIILNPRARR